MNVDSWLSLGGVVVNLYARLDWKQTYEEIGGRATRRLMSGKAVRQTSWTKLKTTITASGAVPPGLDGLDFGAPLALLCAAPRSKAGAGLVYALPQSDAGAAKYRTDSGFMPRGWGYVAETWVETSVAIASHVATLTAVAGATQYRVNWYPSLSVYADLSTETDLQSDDHGWTLTAEEE